MATPGQRWADDMVRTANATNSKLVDEWATTEEVNQIRAAGRFFEQEVGKIVDDCYRRRDAWLATHPESAARDAEFNHGSNKP